MADDPTVASAGQVAPEPQVAPAPQLAPEPQLPTGEPAQPVAQEPAQDFTPDQKTWLGRKIQAAAQDAAAQFQTQPQYPPPQYGYGPASQPPAPQPPQGYQPQPADHTEFINLLSYAQQDPQTYGPQLANYIDQRSNRMLAQTLAQSQRITQGYQQAMGRFQGNPLWKQVEPYLGRAQVQAYEVDPQSGLRWRDPNQVAQETFNAAVAMWATDQTAKPAAFPAAPPRQTAPLGVAPPGQVQAPAVSQAPVAPPDMVDRFYRATLQHPSVYSTEAAQQEFIRGMCEGQGFSYTPQAGGK